MKKVMAWIVLISIVIVVSFVIYKTKESNREYNHNYEINIGK